MSQIVQSQVSPPSPPSPPMMIGSPAPGPRLTGVRWLRTKTNGVFFARIYTNFLRRILPAPLLDSVRKYKLLALQCVIIRKYWSARKYGHLFHTFDKHS